MPNNKRDNLVALLQYSSHGLEMGLCVVIGILMGYYLDKLFHSSPYLTIIFMLFGVAAAVKAAIRLLKKIEKDDERNDNK
ncbi:MAG TPA: AtpZ/AtpI family protein [Syntrophorhabdaceae bacterium]|nr:AtpZ/AtpI family protein [Syntrophorhabdaceae bacterium]